MRLNSLKSGKTIGRQFTGRLTMDGDTLYQSSINIMNVSSEDEGCYGCAVNVYTRIVDV